MWKCGKFKAHFTINKTRTKIFYMTLFSKNDVIEVPVKLRPAEPSDLKADTKNLKIGQPFWLKSQITGKFDNKAYILSYDQDPAEIAEWLNKKMIYVPISDLE